MSHRHTTVAHLLLGNECAIRWTKRDQPRRDELTKPFCRNMRTILGVAHLLAQEGCEVSKELDNSHSQPMVELRFATGAAA